MGEAEATALLWAPVFRSRSALAARHWLAELQTNNGLTFSGFRGNARRAENTHFRDMRWAERQPDGRS